MSERDIKRDREMCEIFATTDEEWHIEPRPMYYVNEAGEPVLGEDGKPLESPHSYLAVVDEDRKEITGFDDNEEGYALARAFIESRTMTPYYLTLCEHRQRMLDEAIAELIGNGDCPISETCEHVWRLNADPPEEVCRKCWSDYLDQKAKEGEGNGR